MPLALAVVLTAAPLAGQTLTPRLRISSPVRLLNLSPALGIPIDSLRSVGRGVWIHDVQLGTGDSVAVGHELAMHYVGMLADGTIFSATRSKPFRFVAGAGKVIDGWEDGVRGMRVGGRRQVVVPSNLGYGAAGSGAVPPDAVLVFDITLIEVTPTR